jgi:hypothetical protein
MTTETIKRCDKCGNRWVPSASSFGVAVTIDVVGSIAGGAVHRVYDFCSWACFRGYTFDVNRGG